MENNQDKKVLNEEQLEDVAGGHQYSDIKGHDFDACIAEHNKYRKGISNDPNLTPEQKAELLTIDDKQFREHLFKHH